MHTIWIFTRNPTVGDINVEATTAGLYFLTAHIQCACTWGTRLANRIISNIFRVWHFPWKFFLSFCFLLLSVSHSLLFGKVLRVCTKTYKVLDKQSLLLTSCLYPVPFVSWEHSSKKKKIRRKREKRSSIYFCAISSPFFLLPFNVPFCHVHMQRSRIASAMPKRTLNSANQNAPLMCTHFCCACLKLNILCEWQIIMLNTEMVFCGDETSSWCGCYCFRCFPFVYWFCVSC